MGTLRGTERHDWYLTVQTHIQSPALRSTGGLEGVLDWSRDVKSVLPKPVEEYMTDLRRRLQQAADRARLHTDNSQMTYAHHNLRSHDKQFAEGDNVIVLDDEASGKLCKRWQGPATVVRVKSPQLSRQHA